AFVGHRLDRAHVVLRVPEEAATVGIGDGVVGAGAEDIVGLQHAVLVLGHGVVLRHHVNGGGGPDLSTDAAPERIVDEIDGHTAVLLEFPQTVGEVPGQGVAVVVRRHVTARVVGQGRAAHARQLVSGIVGSSLGGGVANRAGPVTF